ncbi:MAG: PEP-CTERM sorting domain-containing protein [Okeania sp. SIO2C9]|nr:choice-of-anchor L domain-containing protein [Okeania sp. SIO2C9]NEQ76635.1 PEP-CTERM sorting domain-containing protein [Okeania sp. SIO2C9]
MTISKLIKKFATTLAGTAFVTLSGTTATQAISITPTSNGNDLLNEILGSGITIAPDSINYTGASGASGIFTNGLSSGIGMDSGIILTTGTATDAKGPNDSDKKTTDNEFPGDPDLDELIPGFATEDATILEFDFQTEGGDVFFNYVFASEEYVEWTNSEFNDVFGFFLNGTNIALIPGTSTPVAINTVNGGKPLGTDASNPEFFNNNDPSEGGPFFDLEYDGFTNVFTAQALGLNAGTHHIRLAIADAGDAFLDSAVFIQANSFSDSFKEPEPKSPPTPDFQPKSQLTPDFQPKSQLTPDFQPKSQLTPDFQPKSQPTPDFQPKSQPTPDFQPKSQPTPDFQPKSQLTPDFQPKSQPTPEPDTSIKDAQDIPEPSVVIGLLGVGFAGLYSRKKSIKCNN